MFEEGLKWAAEIVRDMRDHWQAGRWLGVVVGVFMLLLALSCAGAGILVAFHYFL